MLEATICNLPFAIICLNNGIFPLHCSSILNKYKKSVLFCADKGTGKSTLVNELVKNNFILFGDDAVGVEVINNELISHRGIKGIKLLSTQSNSFNKINPITGKYFYYPQENNIEKSAVNNIYLLKRNKNNKHYKKVVLDSAVSHMYIQKNCLNYNLIGYMFYNDINKLAKKISKYTNLHSLIIPDGINDLKSKLPYLNL